MLIWHDIIGSTITLFDAFNRVNWLIHAATVCKHDLGFWWNVMIFMVGVFRSWCSRRPRLQILCCPLVMGADTCKLATRKKTAAIIWDFNSRFHLFLKHEFPFRQSVLVTCAKSQVFVQLNSKKKKCFLWLIPFLYKDVNFIIRLTKYIVEV